MESGAKKRSGVGVKRLPRYSRPCSHEVFIKKLLLSDDKEVLD